MIMQRFTPTLFLLCATLLLGAAAAAAKPLQDYDGKPHQLDEFTGKGSWTIVKIWASDCQVCNDKAHAYVAFHDKHKDSDAQMLGISIDGPAKIAEARAFMKRHGLNYPNLLADYGDVNELYVQLTGEQLAGTPAFLAFAPDGTLLAAQVGAVRVEMLERFMRDNSAPTQ